MKHTRMLPPRLATCAMTALLMTSACSSETTGYPSLGVRPTEKLGFADPEVKAVTAASDPGLDREIAAFAARHDTIAAGFIRDAARSDVTARAARGAAIGSDAWLTAQTALAGLDDWRAQSSTLLTDIEQRATERAAKLEPDYPPLTALRARVAAEADREGATIARIQATLPAA